MGYFFDSKNNIFYHTDIHDKIPTGAVAVDETDYQAIMQGKSLGQVLVGDEKGYPMLTEPPPTSFHHWNGRAWEINEAQQQEVISAEKSAKREQINRKRDDVCFGGIYIETLGKWFDTDETSFVKMIGAKSVMDDDFANGQEVKPELWICADNSVVQLNRDDFALIIRSVKQNVSAMHALAVQHKMQLEQSEKPSEYDFSTGWSKTYAEYVNEQKS